VVGSLAATGLPVVCLNALTGLGTMFIVDTAKVRIARHLLRLALRGLLNRSRSAVLVQNLDDRAVIERLAVDPARIALIPGSGVDVDALMPSPRSNFSTGAAATSGCSSPASRIRPTRRRSHRRRSRPGRGAPT
jgi:hypothetical protein